MLWLTLALVTLYEIYAIALGLMPVVVMNGIFLVLVLVELYLKIRFGSHDQKIETSDSRAR